MIAHRILICILIIGFAGCDFKSADTYFEEAERLSDRGKYREANILLDKAIGKDAKHIGAYINRGANKSALGYYEEAIEDYEKVLILDSLNTLAFFNIGNNYKRRGICYTAIDYYNKAFQSKGGEELYLDFVPNHFFNIDDFDVPGYEINYERGIAYYCAGNMQQAFKDFTNSIDKQYLVPECHYWIGLIHLSAGDTISACESFNISKQLGDMDAENASREYCKN